MSLVQRGENSVPGRPSQASDDPMPGRRRVSPVPNGMLGPQPLQRDLLLGKLAYDGTKRSQRLCSDAPPEVHVNDAGPCQAQLHAAGASAPFGVLARRRKRFAQC